MSLDSDADPCHAELIKENTKKNMYDTLVCQYYVWDPFYKR